MLDDLSQEANDVIKPRCEYFRSGKGCLRYQLVVDSFAAFPRAVGSRDKDEQRHHDLVHHGGQARVAHRRRDQNAI